MVIADNNFRRHANVLIYTGWGESCLRFQGDARTEGNRLVLPNVHDVSVVTPCRMVKKILFPMDCAS